MKPVKKSLLVVAIIFLALGSGFIEVLISPIVEALPSDNKVGSMSFLHSFYCWGYGLVTLLSTLFFNTLGIEKWAILACLWALIPLVGGIMFCFVPIYPMKGNSVDGSDVKESHLYLRSRTFWAIFVMMLCAGASEIAMAEWASIFAQNALGVSKVIGDMAGPCAFALFMATGRVLYAKFSKKVSFTKLLVILNIFGFICYFRIYCQLF